MRFIACLKMDLREGFRESGRNYVLLALATVVVLAFSVLNEMTAAKEIPANSWGEYISACFGGIPPYDPQRDPFFRFPVTWLPMVLAVIFVTLSYPYRDLYGFGKYVLVQSGSRACWWASKCLWVVISTLMSWLVLNAVCLAFTALFGGRFSADVGERALCLLVKTESQDGGSLSIAAFIVYCPIVLSSLSVVQLVISLAVGPVLGFAASSAILLTSAYYCSPLLLGNYLMVARVQPVLSGGVSPKYGAAYALVTIFVASIAGGAFFCRMDCLGKEVAA